MMLKSYSREQKLRRFSWGGWGYVRGTVVGVSHALSKTYSLPPRAFWPASTVLEEKIALRDFELAFLVLASFRHAWRKILEKIIEKH